MSASRHPPSLQRNVLYVAVAFKKPFRVFSRSLSELSLEHEEWRQGFLYEEQTSYGNASSNKLIIDVLQMQMECCTAYESPRSRIFYRGSSNFLTAALALLFRPPRFAFWFAFWNRN